MADHERILQTYAGVATLSAAMADAARAGDWERLVALEHERSVLLNELKCAAPSGQADAAQAKRKAELIAQVLAADAEIRKRVEPKLAELGRQLDSARREQLQRAYQSDQGGLA